MGKRRRHPERVCALGLLLARRMDPRTARDPQLAAALLLHDIGKRAIPDAILRKPGPLDAAELAEVRRHPEEGARLLRMVGAPHRVIAIVRHHHERWDGAGYPDGIAGDEIPFGARVTAVADALDAMTSRRPYRRPLSLDDAMGELFAEAGRQFDPDCVDAFLALDRARVAALLEQPAPGYAVAAARSVASKSVRGIGPTHGDVVPAVR